ncbi:MAG: DUF5658 family protein, partial [Pseudomonadota bacterium]
MEPRAQKTDDRAIEQRDIERRKTSINTMLGALFKQRRRTNRRDGDLVNSYTDWYDHWPLIATVLILLLCSIDAFLTLILLSHGAVELNVLMDWLI